MVSAMNRTNFLEKWAEAGHFLPCVFVMGVLDMRDHGREWLGTPTFLFLDGHSRLTRLLKCGHYLMHVQVCSPTRLPQRLLAAAAVIDAQLFKYSCQSGIFECQLPHTFLGSNGHSFGPPMFVNSWVRLSLRGMPALDFVQRSSGLPA